MIGHCECLLLGRYKVLGPADRFAGMAINILAMGQEQVDGGNKSAKCH